MADKRSALITVINRNFEGINLEALAQQHDLNLIRLYDYNDSVGDIYAAKPLADGPALVVGTGSLTFDGDVAAALGIPLIMVTDGDQRRSNLAAQRVAELGAVVADTVTEHELNDEARFANALAIKAPTVISEPVFQAQLLERAKAVGSHIVLPEGEDDRILTAADQLLRQGIATLTILGDPASMQARADDLGLDLSAATLLDYKNSELLDQFAAKFYELRQHKGISEVDARKAVEDVSYFGVMMVQEGLADGMVSGAVNTTAATLRPALQVIKTTPEASVVSSIFLMVMRDRLWAFGDCAVNPNPTAEQLGEIAVVSARTASQFGIDPKVAILSYSTGSSGAGPDVERSVAALEKARELNPELAVDGPLQFDAACDPGVAARKMPESPVAGHANVFVFPDLEAGNIGYKTAQRTGGALAVGPILQGLNKPVNDLSRGATVPDIVNTVAITAIQAGGSN
ncbi:phosphate acetyltransferase [Corynebacterium cystitidis]|uniref:Phosphate acetyltransferase n=1 Tax=Corynebacterium cystitidis DSM 20524 TaxID=1121357 RepID=A0A1H9V3V4_9CORY|nr:phosphate acetyltransferase [Corynebacterium cystitidis]WJY83359.1 Phosphate acetyltransferase [Corynebacterium cystitidis DSM 20524]SES16352.1 phosphotransacetylase [Corynebacterium cystitidis DSM 20524]SNV62762.1 phosphotransacetylase [Corynebacterium cystitidis]